MSRFWRGLLVGLLMASTTACQTTVVSEEGSKTDVESGDGIEAMLDGKENIADGLGDVSTPDLPEFQPDQLPNDGSSGDAKGCEQGGCFGAPCTDNDDCYSTLCGQHMGESVCTETCIDECPAGWDCQQVDLGGNDPIYMCVSRVEHLCKPCMSGDDCASSSNAAACVDYGDQVGLFCGASCASDDDCPDGFSCLESESAEGGASSQCVLLEGECPCSTTATSLGLATGCVAVNDYGACEGQRTCAQDGLSACDAPTPSEEVCDGVDNDCDGETDETTCLSDNPCVASICSGAGGCVDENLDGADCNDSDACTQSDACLGGACVGVAVDCEDQNVCTDHACDPITGCSTTNNAAPCDDGSVCTSIDTCYEGSCIGSGPPDCDDGNPCTSDECDTETGCSFPPNTNTCDDSDPCTTFDVCENGGCTGTAPLICNDGDPCTDDFCVSMVGCDTSFNTAPCDDLEPCTTIDVCSGGACVGSVEPDCDDGNPCTADTCVLGDGCVQTPMPFVCNDGNACTLVDQCVAGQCLGSSNVQCPLGQSCDTGAGCVDKTVIWGHSPYDLYAVDLATQQVTLVGAFDLGGEMITDVGEAQDGTLYGISFTNLFEIDPTTGKASLISSLSGLAGMVNGLTVAPDGTVYAGTTGGDLYLIDPSTGTANLTGAFGDELTSSGDIVWGPLSVIYVSDPNGLTDQLLSVNPFTAAATPIGDIGFGQVYGLSFANGGLIGLSQTGAVIQINYLTGQGSELWSSGLVFWGGG